MRPSRSPRDRPAWYAEVLLLVGGYLAFGLVRAAIDRGEPAATDNALLVQRVEQALRIAVERALNEAVLTSPAAVHATGWFYRLCVLAVPAVLVWLHARRPERYRDLRTVLVVITLLDLPLVLAFPEAPPRFSLAGVVDYMATHDILNGAASRTPGAGLNLLAAMPSMHVAWTTWCAYAVWSVLRERSPRTAWAVFLFPALVALVVLVTGHHYVLDVVAGVALVAVVVGVTGRLRPERAPSPGP
jgi:hypothetical protein